MSNGAAFDNAPIAVDYWAQTKCPWVKFYFLSHMHSDHYQGLKPTFRNNIYCSTITKSLLIKRIGLVKDNIIDINVGEHHNLHYRDKDGTEKHFLVTCFDANHCAGALMFLFQGHFGNIFYTADFRYDADTMGRTLHIYKGLIDILYLDNTYCDPNCNFPSREEAEQEVFKIMESHPYHIIFLILHSLGRENLLINIAQTFDTKIAVDEERYNILCCLGVDMDHFTNIQPYTSNVRVCSMRDIKRKRYEFRDRKILFIYPTNMKVDSPNLQQNDVKYVGYSDHSCFDELDAFVKLLSPSEIRPLVRRYNGMNTPGKHDRRNMEIFRKHMSSNRKTFSEMQSNLNVAAKAICHLGEEADTNLENSLNNTDITENDYTKENEEVYTKIKRLFRNKRSRSRPSPRGIVFHSNKVIETNITSVNLSPTPHDVIGCEGPSTESFTGINPSLKCQKSFFNNRDKTMNTSISSITDVPSTVDGWLTTITKPSVNHKPNEFLSSHINNTSDISTIQEQAYKEKDNTNNTVDVTVVSAKDKNKKLILSNKQTFISKLTEGKTQSNQNVFDKSRSGVNVENGNSESQPIIITDSSVNDSDSSPNDDDILMNYKHSDENIKNIYGGTFAFAKAYLRALKK